MPQTCEVEHFQIRPSAINVSALHFFRQTTTKGYCMSRIMRCCNHCSPVELYLLKGLRELADPNANATNAKMHLAKIGIEQCEPLISNVVNWILTEAPNFVFHRPNSAFLSADEMGLLASLAQVTCKNKSPFIAPTTSALHHSLSICGAVLYANKIQLKHRPSHIKHLQF